MAIHSGVPPMLQESLPEMLLVAKYCIEFRKDKTWPALGCYGYPAALLLLSIVDSIGSYVEGRSVENHFKVLNNVDYYGQSLSDEEIHSIYDRYRNTLSHHSVMAEGILLDIGSAEDSIFDNINGVHKLNLVPHYNASVQAVTKFLSSSEILINNRAIIDIAKK